MSIPGQSALVRQALFVKFPSLSFQASLGEGKALSKRNCKVQTGQMQEQMAITGFRLVGTQLNIRVADAL